MTIRPPRIIRRGVNFAVRLARRARVFPFSLVYPALSAGVRLARLHGLTRSETLARVGEASVGVSPLGVLIWLDRIATKHPARTFDVCLRLPKEAEEANLHDVFSILMVSPRLISLGLYWDEASLADDLPYFQRRRGRAVETVGSEERDDLGSLGREPLAGFIAAGHDRFDVPVAAARDAQTLLKRQAGGAGAVCLNPPAGTPGLTAAVALAFPDLRFFDFQSFDATPATHNLVPIGAYGLTLHERMALVAAADAYVGRFDELGGAAVIAGRPAVLLDDQFGAPADASGRGPATLQLLDTSKAEVTEEVLRFLRRLTAAQGG